MVEGAHPVRTHSASRFFPIFRGPQTRQPDHSQLKGPGGADFDNPLHRVRAGEFIEKASLQAGLAVRSRPPRALFHFAICNAYPRLAAAPR